MLNDIFSYLKFGSDLWIGDYYGLDWIWDFGIGLGQDNYNNYI